MFFTSSVIALKTPKNSLQNPPSANPLKRLLNPFCVEIGYQDGKSDGEECGEGLEGLEVKEF